VRPWACSRVHTSLCAARGQARGWATAVSAGVHEGGMERNSAAYVFDVSFTLTEAGLAAAPGARPRSARSPRRSHTRAQHMLWCCAARSPRRLAARGPRVARVLCLLWGLLQSKHAGMILKGSSALCAVLCMRTGRMHQSVRRARAGPSSVCMSRTSHCC